MEKYLNEIPKFTHVSTALRIRNKKQTSPYIMFGIYNGEKVKVIYLNKMYDTISELIAFRLFINTKSYSELYNFCFPKLILTTKNYCIFEYIEGLPLNQHTTKSRLIIDIVDKYILSNQLDMSIDWEVKNFIINKTGVYHIDIDAFNFKGKKWK